MQNVSTEFLDALAGSVEPVFTADVYYGGKMIRQGLPIAGGQVDIDESQTVRGSCSLIINDPDGALVPRLRSDALAPYGQEINIRAGLQIAGEPETVSLGWYRIQAAAPKESWRWIGKQAEAVASGATIPVQGRDRGSLLTDYPFMTPETPQHTNVWSEIVRLTAGLLPVTHPGFDAGIPNGSIVYETDRWAAITTLAKLCSAHPVITMDGTLTLVLDEPAGAVWELDAGENGTVGQFSPTLDRTLIKNAVNVQGLDSSGNPITVILTQNDGPLRWGGPFGCVPADQIVDPLLDTENKVTARARQELAKAIAGTAQQIEMPTVLNYALEVGDVVQVNLPRRSGALPVTKLTFPSRGLMTATVAVPAEWLISE